MSSVCAVFIFYKAKLLYIQFRARLVAYCMNSRDARFEYCTVRDCSSLLYCVYCGFMTPFRLYCAVTVTHSCHCRSWFGYVVIGQNQSCIPIKYALELHVFGYRISMSILQEQFHLITQGLVARFFATYFL